jgi:hypothetical protein
MQSTEVVDSLRNIRGEVEAHLRNVKEYRAFLSIQAAMDEIAHVGELHSPLEGVREGVRQRLNELREYRALLAVEKSITDIADVLGLLDEIAPRPVASPLASPAAEPAAVDAVTTEAAVTAVTAEVTSEEQLVTAPSEPAPRPAEAAVATEAAEAVPAPTEFVAAAAPSEAEAVTTPAQATAEIPATEADASQAVDIVVPAELLADAAATSEVAPIHAEQDFEPQHVVPAAASVPAESPIPLVAAESNPEGAPSDFGSAHAQQESHQAVPDDDQVIAKVA